MTPRRQRRPRPATPAPADGAPADGAPAFDLVRRGYDRAQVDAHLALPPERRPRPAAFDLARIGYDRTQVDRALATED
ncbi:hypothetical protein ACIQBJ_15685 [Kitasatospora sp. NPDC088391]|uniref:hypothetical protein n=1 Tax=Kitasatospora sp. NPDC088391 TaxID=3364074 RepID=UPI00380471A9